MSKGYVLQPCQVVSILKSHGGMTEDEAKEAVGDAPEWCMLLDDGKIQLFPRTKRFAAEKAMLKEKLEKRMTELEERKRVQADG